MGGKTKKLSLVLDEDSTELLTIDQVKEALPPGLRNVVTPAFVDKLNNAVSDPIVAEEIRNNFISYSSVLREGKFKLKDYLYATKYVSFKIMGLSNQEAYAKTFPKRYKRLVDKGLPQKAIAAYVHAYNKGKLVNLIMEQTIVPTWVLNRDLHQKAINRLAYLMVEAESEYVQATAANSLLQHLKKPKAAGPLINLDMRESSGLDELNKLLTDLASKQADLISKGIASTAEVAKQKIIEVKHDDEV